LNIFKGRIGVTRNNWKLDILKGHIQKNESPLDAAIRECREESNIHFERWKLSNPIQVNYKCHPLFMFLAKIDKIINTSLLSCASTFVDTFDGIRKPEVEAYVWINPRTHLHLIQKELHSGIQYYFSKVISEDCQIAGPMMGDLPQNVGSTLFAVGFNTPPLCGGSIMATLKIHGSKPHMYKNFPLQKKNPRRSAAGIFYFDTGGRTAGS
jgi:hypothetical protein